MNLESPRDTPDVCADLSVVIVPLMGGPVLDAAIRRCGQQASEITVVCAEEPRAPEDVRWIRCPSTATVPERRAIGVDASTKRVVAVIEDTIQVGRAWGRAVLDSFRPGVWAVGGTLTLSPSLPPRHVALALLDYGPFLQDGPVSRCSLRIPGNNLGFEREAISTTAMFRSGVIREAELIAEWSSNPGAVRLESGMNATLYYVDPSGTSSRSRFHHGRAYAGNRLPKSARCERLVRGLTAPALVPLFLGRTAPHLLKRVTAVPHVLALSTAWCVGEVAGYAFGAGTSERHWK